MSVVAGSDLREQRNLDDRWNTILVTGRHRRHLRRRPLHRRHRQPRHPQARVRGREPHRLRGTRGTSGNGGDGGLANAAAASLASPVGVWLDGTKLYIASSTAGLTKIRRVSSLSGGNISTVMGTNANGNAGDHGPATSATLTTPFDAVVGGVSPFNLYVSSGGYIRKVIGPVP